MNDLLDLFSSNDATAPTLIAITFNRERRIVCLGNSLGDLLAELGLPADAVATAVNGQFVARTARALRLLHAGDVVVAVQPIAGG